MDYKYKPCDYDETSCRANPCAGNFKSVQVFELIAGKFTHVKNSLNNDCVTVLTEKGE